MAALSAFSYALRPIDHVELSGLTSVLSYAGLQLAHALEIKTEQSKMLELIIKGLEKEMSQEQNNFSLHFDRI